jgi:hypothetical protein
MRVKEKASTLGGSHHHECCGVILELDLVLYHVVSVVLVLPRHSSTAAHTENCVGCRGSVVEQLQTELITLHKLSMASGWKLCVPCVSSHGSTDKLGDVGCCGRRGKCPY